MLQNYTWVKKGSKVQDSSLAFFPITTLQVKFKKLSLCSVLWCIKENINNLERLLKHSIFLFFFSFLLSFFLFFICSEFCHTLEWNSHGFTCVPHPDPPSHLPLHLLPLGFPSALGPSACLMHLTWAGDLFHPRYYTCFDAVLLKHPTLSFSHRV